MSLSSNTLMKENCVDELIPKENDEIKTFHSDEDDYTNYEEADFFPRLIAIVIDGFILAFINKVFSALIPLVFGALNYPPLETALIIVINIFLPTLYQIFFLMEFGQTLGKKAMKIKVVYQTSNDPLRFGTVVLREPIGKLISSLFFFLGYIVVLFGKRAWHDNIADTKVIKVK